MVQQIEIVRFGCERRIWFLPGVEHEYELVGARPVGAK